MNNCSNNRRKNILHKLKSENKPVTGADLSSFYKVSRQVVVQDIAILRAAGNEIIATPKGYLISNLNDRKIRKVYAVKHDIQDIERELLIVVDTGGKVMDVIIEHAIYGELKGLLMLECREDVYSFIKSLKRTESKPLSLLTEGVHLHTIETNNEECHEKIAKKLAKEGFLLESFSL